MRSRAFYPLKATPQFNHPHRNPCFPSFPFFSTPETALPLAESWTHYAVIYGRDNGTRGRCRHEKFACIGCNHRAESTRARTVGRSVTGNGKPVPLLYCTLSQARQARILFRVLFYFHFRARARDCHKFLKFHNSSLISKHTVFPDNILKFFLYSCPDLKIVKYFLLKEQFNIVTM